MTEFLLALVPDYGLWLIGAITFLSCLAVPVPSSILMVAGGAFSASGDLAFIPTAAAALAGALAGDQAGYAIGKRGGRALSTAPGASHGPESTKQALIRRAREFSARWGAMGVFLSRWLFSPLGPYVNFISGATGLGWRAFTLWGGLGETVWVLLYTGLGYVFSDQIQMVADIASNISGFLAAGALALVLGRMVLRAGRSEGFAPKKKE